MTRSFNTLRCHMYMTLLLNGHKAPFSQSPKMSKMWHWACLVSLRLGWALWPQGGYIHPDEFFQTVEIVAGDAFNIDVHRTWEFNEDFPIRSIVLPKLLFQPVFTFLNYIDQNTNIHALKLSGYKTLAGPRLVMAILSLCIDIVVYKLCTLMNLDGYKGIVLLASSYVMLTYQCHTFSNSIETLLFTLLLFVILESIIQHRDCSKGSPSEKLQASEAASNQPETDVKISVSSKIGSDEGAITLNRSTHARNAQVGQEQTAEHRLATTPQSFTSSPSVQRTEGDGVKDCGSVDKTGTTDPTGAEDNRPRRRKRNRGKVKISDDKKTSNEFSHKSQGSISGSEQKEQKESINPIVQTMSQSISSDICMKTCILIAFINIVGIFNRPTFILFSCLPILYWFLYCVYPLWRDGKIVPFFDRVSVLILTSVFTVLLFCEIDTRYFKGISFMFVLISSASSCFMITDTSEIFSCYRLVVSEFTVVTPWNFIVYNTKYDNLAEHGIHPPYLHMLVNMPLLFGPLVFYIVKSLSLHIKSSFYTISKTYLKSKSKSHRKSRGNKMNLSSKADTHEKKPKEIPMHLFIIVPVLLFSLFPHQEPRFLIALLPVVILDAVLVAKSFGRCFITFLVIFNILLSIVFGIFHQGGLVPCLMNLQTQINTFESRNQSDVSLNFIFSHTYMPPQHVLLNKKSNVNIIDLKGSNSTVLLDTINSVKLGEYFPAHEDINGLSYSSTNRIFLTIPGSVIDDMGIYRLLNVSVIHTFFPHLSFEDPPKFGWSSSNITPGFFAEIYHQLSLVTMEIV